MEILFLDKDVTIIKYSKVTSLQWHRKYYEPGQFVVQILAEDYNADIRFVKLSNRNEIGMVQKVQYEQTVKGAFVQLSGFFAERILWEWVNYPTYYCNKKITNALYWVMDYIDSDDTMLINKFSIPIQDINGIAGELSCNVAGFQNTGDYMGETVYKVLKEAGCSISILNDVDAETNICHMEVWKGRDRTQNQSANSYATFSTSFGNMKNIKLTIDDSNYKNVAIVAGAGEGDARYNVTVDESGEKDKYRVFINASQESPDDYSQTDPAFTNYLNALKQIGRNKLITDYNHITNIEFDAVQKNIVYLHDYDLGDKCDIIVDELNKSFEARLIEVLETWEKGEHTVSLTFGDKIPTKYEKVRLR